MDYFSNKCGYVSKRGAECGYWAVEDSPVNLCQEHLLLAFRYVNDNQKDLNPRAKAFGYKCRQCNSTKISHPVGFKLDLSCDHCGNAAKSTEFDYLGKPYSAIHNPERHPPVERVVYYISHGDRIKIGTTTNWKQRMTALQHDRILALEPGSYEMEKQRHVQFDALRVGTTEWFKAGAELWDHVIELNEAHPEFQAVIDKHNTRKSAALSGRR